MQSADLHCLALGSKKLESAAHFLPINIEPLCWNIFKQVLAAGDATNINNFLYEYFPHLFLFVNILVKL